MEESIEQHSAAQRRNNPKLIIQILKKQHDLPRVRGAPVLSSSHDTLLCFAPDYCIIMLYNAIIALGFAGTAHGLAILCKEINVREATTGG